MLELIGAAAARGPCPRVVESSGTLGMTRGRAPGIRDGRGRIAGLGRRPSSPALFRPGLLQSPRAMPSAPTAPARFILMNTGDRADRVAQAGLLTTVGLEARDPASLRYRAGGASAFIAGAGGAVGCATASSCSPSAADVEAPGRPRCPTSGGVDRRSRRFAGPRRARTGAPTRRRPDPPGLNPRCDPAAHIRRFARDASRAIALQKRRHSWARDGARRRPAASRCSRSTGGASANDPASLQFPERRARRRESLAPRTGRETTCRSVPPFLAGPGHRRVEGFRHRSSRPGGEQEAVHARPTDRNRVAEHLAPPGTLRFARA